MAAAFMEFSILLFIIIGIYLSFIYLLFYHLLFKPRGLNYIQIYLIYIVHGLHVGNMDFRIERFLQNLSVSFYVSLFVSVNTVNMHCVCVFVCFCIYFVWIQWE